jgi:hypothetical protein
MSDRITDDKLDHLIRIQDMLRCQMAHAMAATDGFDEGNVHAGVYRALVELKALREAAGKVICYECGATGKIHQGGVPGEWLPCPDCADLRALLNPEAPR